MLLFIFILFIINILLICFFYKKSVGLLHVMLYVSFLLLLSGFYIFFIKSGGFFYNNKYIVFGNKTIYNYFLKLPINLNLLSVLLSFSRLSFALLFFLSTIEKNYSIKQFFNKYKFLYYCFTAIIIFAFIISIPNVFNYLFAYKYMKQTIVIKILDSIIYFYLSSSIIIIIIEYYDIHLDYMKNRQILYMISQVLLTLQFLFFSKIEPIVVFQDYNRIKQSFAFFPFIGGNIENYWIVVLIFCIASTFLNIYENWKYYKVIYDRGKKEMTIIDKVDSTKGSSSILIHGLKNQLLVSEILINEIKEKISQNQEFREVESLIDSLNENHLGIQKRLDILYKSFIQINTKLVLSNSYTIRNLTQQKINSKYNCSNIYWKIRNGIILCDENLLSEALCNLICNAIEACNNTKDPLIMVKILFLNKKTIISVYDNGPGIPKKLKNKIFQPFTTTKNSLTNWGMGLCYTKMIIEKQMGEITYVSKENKGTTFIITFPKYKGVITNGKD